MIPLDVVSDPICPWCYIGKIRLDRAMEQRPDHPLSLRWRPFQLNPEMPPEGMERQQYLQTKFGGKEAAARVYDQIQRVADEAGLSLDLSAIPRTPNTIDAHRLIRWAGVEGRQTLIANQLFHRYFEKHQDISDHEVLVDIARTGGLDADVMRRLLASDADLEETRAADAEAREIGITGVPTFIVANKYAVPGAQDTDMWIKVIDDLVAADAPPT